MSDIKLLIPNVFFGRAILGLPFLSHRIFSSLYFENLFIKSKCKIPLPQKSTKFGWK